MSDFEVMDQMSKDNMDIAMFPDLIEANKIKGGFKISFGVPEPVGQAIAQDLARTAFGGEPEYFTVMYRINRKQFNELKNASNP